MPFGPALAIGVVITFLGWQSIGGQFQPLLFFGEILIGMAVVSCVLMMVAGFIIRLMRRE